MSLLELEGVRKRREDGGALLLREVSLRIEAGELAVVWGMRGSGRSTLLRIAAGIEPPDAGAVRFEGRDLSGRGRRLLGEGIGYCHRTLRFGESQSALEHAMVGPLSRWVAPAAARRRALAALERVGAAHCAGLRQHKLTGGEAVRVALARTLALAPRMVVVDEPVAGVDLAERDGVLGLLRSLADEGVAVLASTGESTGLSQADRAFALGEGTLRSAPQRPLAAVVQLRRAASGGS